MRKITIQSPFTVEEISAELQVVTEKFHSDSSKGFLFEGKVSSTAFKILPTFDYGARNQLRPLINGVVTNNGNRSLIQINFTLPDSLKNLFIVAAVVNIGFAIFLFFNPIADFVSWPIFVGFIITTALIFSLLFHSKINASIKVLNKILTQKNESP